MDGDSDLEVEQNDELQKFLGTSSFGKQSRNAPKDASVKKQVEATKRPVAQKAIDEKSSGPASRKEKDSDDDSSQSPTRCSSRRTRKLSQRLLWILQAADS
jgi:hypothetical protein